MTILVNKKQYDAMVKENVLLYFISHTSNYHKDSIINSVNEIAYCFIWSATPQGRRFWSKIDNLWDEEIIKINTNDLKI